MRGIGVTGVRRVLFRSRRTGGRHTEAEGAGREPRGAARSPRLPPGLEVRGGVRPGPEGPSSTVRRPAQIGRASCRERVEISVVALPLTKRTWSLTQAFP